MSRLVFAGTPVTAVPSLRRLVEAGEDVVGVLTRPDAPLGRRRVMTPSPVAAAAQELGVPVIKADRIDDETQAALVALEADLGVVVAYGALLPRRTLEATARGWANLHFSLLPSWRGAAPVQHALLNGDPVTGASVFLLEEGMDTGPLLATLRAEVGERDTAGELLARLADEGADVLARTVSRYLAGDIVPTPQEGEITLAPKLGREDGRVDFSLPAASVKARIAGTTPEPGAFTAWGDGVLKLGAVTEVSDVTDLAPGEVRSEPGGHGRVLVGTADHAVELGEVQPAGKRVMAARDWARGQHGGTVRLG